MLLFSSCFKSSSSSEDAFPSSSCLSSSSSSNNAFQNCPNTPESFFSLSAFFSLRAFLRFWGVSVSSALTSELVFISEKASTNSLLSDFFNNSLISERLSSALSNPSIICVMSISFSSNLSTAVANNSSKSPFHSLSSSMLNKSVLFSPEASVGLSSCSIFSKSSSDVLRRFIISSLVSSLTTDVSAKASAPNMLIKSAISSAGTSSV